MIYVLEVKKKGRGKLWPLQLFTIKNAAEEELKRKRTTGSMLDHYQITEYATFDEWTKRDTPKVRGERGVNEHERYE